MEHPPAMKWTSCYAYQQFKQLIKQNVEWRKPDTNEPLLCDSTWVKLKNQSVGLEVQREVATGTKTGGRRGDMVFSGATVSVLFLDLGASWTGVFTNTSLIQHHVPGILNSVRDPGA